MVQREQGEVVTGPQGNVVLTKSCWENHILKDHPELSAFKNEVIETLTAPDKIFSNPSNTRNLRTASLRYYRKLDAKVASEIGNGSILVVPVLKTTNDIVVTDLATGECTLPSGSLLATTAYALEQMPNTRALYIKKSCPKK